LLGQPTLRRRLRLGAFAALDQRVGLRYSIAPLDLGECSSYIACHLAFALLTELPAAGSRSPKGPVSGSRSCMMTGTMQSTWRS
ncbi:MAG: hypothetical protein ACREN7_05165, partial [Candidatus Dormibacteria bacterium]